VDAALEVREYIEPHLIRGELAIILSIDVQGSFGLAWWPAILQRLRHKMTHETLLLSTRVPEGEKSGHDKNNFRIDKTITRGSPQGGCSGPGIWNIQYDTVLNLQYKKNTRVIAFEDDMLEMIRAEYVGEGENNTNIEMDKITYWARDNEEKSKAMLLTRRKKRTG